MLTRAIITDLNLNDGKIQIRIPWLDGVQNSGVSPMSDNVLSWASILCIPGINIDYKVGDVVIVGFEDNNMGKPIVLGYLKLSNTDMPSKIYGNFKELQVSDSFKSPLNTLIGSIDYNKLFTVVDKEGTID